MKKALFLGMLVCIAFGTFHFVNAQKSSAATPASNRPAAFTNANVTLANNAGACCYRAIFIQGGVETPFLFTTSGSTTFTAALAPGTYQLGVAPLLGASGTHTYSWSCGPDNGSASGTSALFSNVTVYSAATITVSIN